MFLILRAMISGRFTSLWRSAWHFLVRRHLGVRIMRLLNIESSPRGSRSASIAVTGAFFEAYRQACPGVVVDTLNVWEEKLPDFDQEAIGPKYKGMDQAEAAVWDKIQELAGRFQQADRIVLGVPMWNLAYPYKPAPRMVVIGRAADTPRP